MLNRYNTVSVVDDIHYDRPDILPRAAQSVFDRTYGLVVGLNDELPPPAVLTHANELETASNRCAGVLGLEVHYRSARGAKRMAYDEEKISYSEFV